MRNPGGSFFFRMFGSDTSHTAIEAIGGLNLPGGGTSPFIEKTHLGGVKWLSSVKKSKIPAMSFSSVAVLLFISSREFYEDGHSPILKSPPFKNHLTQKESFELLKRDSIP